MSHIGIFYATPFSKNVPDKGLIVSATIYDFASMVKKLSNPPNRIREQRLAKLVNGKAMTQAQLADAIGVKPNLISRYETSDREISLHRLRQIARALDTDIGGLLSPEDNAHGLDEREREVVDVMREGDAHAEMITRVAETARNFGQPPAAPVTPIKRQAG